MHLLLLRVRSVSLCPDKSRRKSCGEYQMTIRSVPLTGVNALPHSVFTEVSRNTRNVPFRNINRLGSIHLTASDPIVEIPTADAVDPHPWYAIRVRSNFEKISSVALADRGVEVFLPTFQVSRRWSDRTRQMECPLFPGYLFSRIDMQNRLPVLTAPGIIQIIGAARTPIPVPDAQINALKAVLSSRLAFEPWPYGCVGERVVVKEGPLAGVGGTLVRVKRNLRLLVSVELLQRSVIVEVDADWIARPNHSVHDEAVSLLMSSAASRCASAPIHAIPVPAM